jgi:hypothetical protein
VSSAILVIAARDIRRSGAAAIGDALHAVPSA